MAAWRTAERILLGPGAGVKVRARTLVLAIVLAGGAYGAVMGSYGGLSGERAAQMLFAALKVPLLLLVTTALALPPFFVLNTLLGLRADFAAVLRAVAGTQAALAVVLASLAPYTLLWYVSTSDYHEAILFNGLMFGTASFAAQLVMFRAYRPLIARDPRHRAMQRLWVLLYAFVGIQMGWILRPFIGYPGMSVTFFRADTWGNAYVVVVRMIAEQFRW